MGQYWKPVNLDKKEFINPHQLGSGLKLWEQLANHPGVGAALIILAAAMPEARGGGDFDLDQNWHGPERTFPEHNATPAPMPEEYQAIAARTIGRWAGDRIALVGDYAEDDDLPNSTIQASKIWDLCSPETEYFYSDDPEGCMYKVGHGEHKGKYAHSRVITPAEFTDVTDDVCAVIEHELTGKFSGKDWREFRRNGMVELALTTEDAKLLIDSLNLVLGPVHGVDMDTITEENTGKILFDSIRAATEAHT